MLAPPCCPARVTRDRRCDQCVSARGLESSSMSPRHPDCGRRNVPSHRELARGRPLTRGHFAPDPERRSDRKIAASQNLPAAIAGAVAQFPRRASRGRGPGRLCSFCGHGRGHRGQATAPRSALAESFQCFTICPGHHRIDRLFEVHPAIGQVLITIQGDIRTRRRLEIPQMLQILLHIR